MLASADLVDSATVVGVLISLAPIFQIVKMIRSGSSRNVSALYAVSLDAGFAFFFAYSLVIRNAVFAISYAVALSVGLVNLCTILWLRRRPHAGAPAQAPAPAATG